MEKEYIKIGALISTQGLKGNFKVFPTTTFVGDRFKVGAKLVARPQVGEGETKLTISKIQDSGNSLVVTFKEITTIEEAEKLLKHQLYILKDKAPLPEGYIYLDDLLKMKVVLKDGTIIGYVSEILEYASYFTLRVKRVDLPDLLIPYIEPFIIETNKETQEIVFAPIEGML